jgi:3-isopropylmalate/(R)-2-methylmalate dehydratase small subunit
MQPFVRLTGLVVPLDRPNIDTDAIIPKQFIKSIRRTGFGQHLFDEWRYLDPGALGQDCSRRRLNPDFALNDPRYQGARILLARENFGCGSSREHAVWALQDYGLRVLIAPSFADIFFGNCFKNGLLPIVLDAGTINAWFNAAAAASGFRLDIDLEAKCIRTPDGQVHSFEIDASRRNGLLNGWDDIALTLRHAEAIRAYEAERRKLEPWLWA